MVPANSGLKAYSQSCISLSFVACSRIPLCSVHTANVLGVWRSEKQSTNYLLDFSQELLFNPFNSEAPPHPQQGLFVLAVFHFGRRQVDDSSLHAVPLAAVQVDVGPAHHHVALHPAAGVGLQEVQVTLLWHNWAANKHKNPDIRQVSLKVPLSSSMIQIQTIPLYTQRLRIKWYVSPTWHGSPVCRGQRCILSGPSFCPLGWMGPDLVWKLLNWVQCVYTKKLKWLNSSQTMHLFT